jgi:hypothetical protein
MPIGNVFFPRLSHDVVVCAHKCNLIMYLKTYICCLALSIFFICSVSSQPLMLVSFHGFSLDLFLIVRSNWMQKLLAYWFMGSDTEWYWLINGATWLNIKALAIIIYAVSCFFSRSLHCKMQTIESLNLSRSSHECFIYKIALFFSTHIENKSRWQC